MKSRASHPLLALCALAAVAPALAQNTNSSMEGCGMHAQSIASGRAAYNATGSIPFNFENDAEEWHLTYGLIDEREENHLFGRWVTMQTLAVFLSVPEDVVGSRRGNDTDYCVYLIAGRNETSDADPGDGNNSCDGVLSEDCISALRDASPPTDDSCPLVDSEDACGFRPWLGRTAPSNLSSARCSVDHVPGVDLPSDYHTFDAKVGSGLIPPDASRDSFEVYDLRVQQPVPFLITARERSSSRWRSQVLCLAPSNVTEGSREPEGEFPPSSASRRWVSAVGVAVAVAVVGLVHV